MPIVAAASVLRFALPEIADAFSARIGTAQLHSDGTLADLGDALVDGRLEHLAIANPETAPYGRAARQVLEHLGLWHKVQATLVIGENVAQATQFAVSGTAEAGLVAYSLAVSSRLDACCRFVGIPSEMYTEMHQRGVLIKSFGEDARAFFHFLLGPEGRNMMPLGLVIARFLAWRDFPLRGFVEALIALPLPPTVLGCYLLVSFSPNNALGAGFQALFGQSLAFSFECLVLASVIFNLPFAVQPLQRAFETVPRSIREAACPAGRRSGVSSCRSPGPVRLPPWP